MAEDKLPRASLFVSTWELGGIADSMYNAPEEIMFHRCVCSVRWCIGNRFNTGEGSENFISRFRICFPVWWNCGPFPLSTSYSLSVAGCFAVLLHLFSDRFLKIAWDLREPSGCCAENWEQLGVGFCVSPTLSWTYCCSACWPAAEVGGSSSMIHAILPLYIGTSFFKKRKKLSPLN